MIYYDRFVALEELKEFIGAADIYITPYLNQAQITSGTLAYAFGAGKATISTPYWHAQEILDEGRGRIVPFRDPGAIAEAVCELLENPARLQEMRANAYRLGREMIWPAVARRYMESFQRACAVPAGRGPRRAALLPNTRLAERPYQLPPFRLDHLFRMSDNTGIFQHAIFNVPNYAEGYCTDDNARAFLLTVLLEELGDRKLAAPDPRSSGDQLPRVPLARIESRHAPLPQFHELRAHLARGGRQRGQPRARLVGAWRGPWSHTK